MGRTGDRGFAPGSQGGNRSRHLRDAIGYGPGLYSLEGVLPRRPFCSLKLRLPDHRRHAGKVKRRGTRVLMDDSPKGLQPAVEPTDPETAPVGRAATD